LVLTKKTNLLSPDISLAQNIPKLHLWPGSAPDPTVLPRPPNWIKGDRSEERAAWRKDERGQGAEGIEKK